ncbi:cupin domain-containing protein [Acutalibacter muris]|uniref:cupin domain-containing protein n=1 Tax=Acutalibacter muris TaxID=1796620 RepID=UPI0020CF0ADB|nr:cupin domain-containing protein [Acutalibacter muris]
MEFMTPEGHTNFHAKILFDCKEAGRAGKIQWGALAYIDKDGGGPKGNHTHESAHIFIVTEGRIRVMLGETAHTVNKDESFYVPGMVPHSIWNDGGETAKVIKLNVLPE